MIDMRQFSYFIAVVEAKSFTAAADVLCVAQPALSQYLQRLEQEIGRQLLVRHSRGIEPTQAGLRLLEHARSILTMVEGARNDLRHYGQQPRQRIRLGMPRSLCDTFAVELMAIWPNSHPDITLQIVERSSNALTESVLAGRLDLAITSYPSDSNMLIAEPLLQDKICAVMPAREACHELGKIRFAELVHEPLILNHSSNLSRQLIELTAKYCSVSLNVAYEIDSADLAIKMVEAGLASTIQPYLAVKSYLGKCRAAMRLIVGPSMTRRLHLIRARYRLSTSHEVDIRKTIKDLLAHQFAKDKPLLELDFATS